MSAILDTIEICDEPATKLGERSDVCASWMEAMPTDLPSVPSSPMTNASYRDGLHAWGIYASQMFHHGHGYPLWMPDPDPSASQVRIGDVGWIKLGGFMQLFNAMKSEREQPVRYGVPDGFDQFNPPNLIISGPHERITKPPLWSRTINLVDVSGGASASTGPVPVATAGASFSFKCSADAGAVLIFSPTGYSRDIESKRHIVTYMSKNFNSWVDFSAKWGLDLKDEDILFVSGTTMTNKWAVAAFTGQYKKKQGSLTADLSSVGSLNLSVSISNEMIPQSYYRVGPSRRPLSSSASAITQPSGDSESGAEEEPADQCIFMHYYKMKRRLWSYRPMKAAAGPDELPPPGPEEAEAEPMVVVDEDSMSEDSIEEVPGREKTFDPVNDLLDYILQNSEASVAIASDRDIHALFKDQDFPDDVANALAQLQPTIDLDENGVGTVSVPIEFSAARRITDIGDEESFQDLLGMGSTPPELGQQDDPLLPDNTETDEEKPLRKHAAIGAPTSAHDGSVTSIAYSPDGTRVASGSEDTTLIIWDTHANTALYKLTAHMDTVAALAFSPDSQVLASGSSDGDIILWQVRNGQEIRRLTPGAAVYSAAFTPDGARFIAGLYDGALHVLDTATYETVQVIAKHLAVVTFIVFSPDGRLMATGGTECECYVWEVASLDAGEPISVLEGHEGMVCSAAFSPDGRRIVTASDDGSSRVWNAEAGDALVILHEHIGPVWTAAFSPDGKRVASGSSDSKVIVCDSFTGARLLSLEQHNKMINAVAFSPNGKYIAAASADNTVRLWDAADGSVIATFNEHSDNVTSVLFSPDDKTLVSGSHDGTVRIRSLPH